MELIGRVAGYRDNAWLLRMFELAMASALAGKIPAIRVKLFQ
jgi:hypothetical protein